MKELRDVLVGLGVEEVELLPDSRIREHLALDSTETVELESLLRRRFGVIVNLWDTHDYTLRELDEQIGQARGEAAAVIRIPAARARGYERDGLWGNLRVDELVLGSGVEGEALVAGGRRLSHSELRDAVVTAAARLSSRGVRRGDRVVVQLPNDVELIVLTLALSRLGAPAVLAPVTLRRHELEQVVRVTQPAAIAVPHSYARFSHLDLARQLAADHACLRLVLVAGTATATVTDPAGDTAADGGAATLIDLTALCRPSGTRPLPDDPGPATLEDPALCLLSSGTTGPPKVIPRIAQAYAYQLLRTVELSGVGPESVYLAVMPATHGFVLGCPGVLGTLAAGGRVVLGSSAEPSVAFDLVERESVTHTTLVPALAQRWVEAAATSGADLSSLRVIQVGGARPRPDQVDRIPAVLGCQVQQCYGMSEGLLCYTALDDPDEVVFGTQGRPASSADEVRVVDAAGEPVPPGEVGELLTRGPYTVAGYYADPEADRECFTPDGFYHTGDLVRWGPSGCLVVEGRVRDVINRGGEKISAVELDLLVAQHPAVAAAAAVAGPHPRYGEEICLYVVPSPGHAPDLDELRSFLVGRGLARYKLPERLEVVPELPVLGIGKVDKKTLRSWAHRLAAERR
ncbi:AMP-binding protein [Parafrankia sp. FMc2]|uniref:AMP-binding protein n=1 Tax=Parafrankia sp. FMc2 TaxID=3233196 RepID=UPI0034D73750